MKDKASSRPINTLMGHLYFVKPAIPKRAGTTEADNGPKAANLKKDIPK